MTATLLEAHGLRTGYGRLPVVFNVTPLVNVCVPPSPVVNVYAGGSEAAASELAKLTVPW